MKRTQVFFLSQLFCLALCAQWNEQDQFLTTNELFDVRMLTADRGVVVGEGNILLCTVDGGLSPWDGGGSFDPDIQTASIASGVIYFGNVAGAIFTEDNPGTCDNDLLAPPSITTDDLTDIHQVDASTGFAVANNNLLYSSNSWAGAVALTSNGCTGDYNCIWFNSADRGFAGTLGGKIFLVTPLGPDFLCTEVASTGKRINGIHFADADNGWAVGNDGAVFRTSDAGETWTDQNFPRSENLRAVYATSATTVHVVGNGIYRWDHAASSWRETHSPSAGPPLNAVWFEGPNLGWAVGLQGRILATGNGGGGGSPVVGLQTPVLAAGLRPNPVASSGSLAGNLRADGRVELQDLQGRLIDRWNLSSGSFEIKMPALNPGIYLLRAGISAELIVVN